MEIRNEAGLLLTGENQYLGYLFHSPEHGTFEPNLGKVEIDPETADKHNKLLSQAEILGLDENCEVGMGGTFYYTDKGVTTFVGDIVSPPCDVHLHGSVITFHRKGKTFRGRLSKDADSFNFRRIR